MKTLEIIIIALCLILIVIGVVLLISICKANKHNNNTKEEISKISAEMQVSLNKIIKPLIESINLQNSNYHVINEKINDLTNQFRNLNNSNYNFQKDFLLNYNDSFVKIIKVLNDNNEKAMNKLKNELNDFTCEIKEQLSKIEQTVSTNLKSMRDDNNNRLDKMQSIVDEKLQSTLDKRLNESFNSVVEQLSTVNKTVGEIKGLANDVGSLKNVLTNCKTKGILGEVILSTLIKDMLSPSQYDENVETKKGSLEKVEFAIKLPGTKDNVVYLPVDSKFPTESYRNMVEAANIGNKLLTETYRKELRRKLKEFAKSIRDKYIDPPNTTEFGIMFLPTEGLYSEAINMGLLEELQQEYKITITGPSTLTALLNALQMGFKTLVIEKKSAEVFKILGAVKTEFAKFESLLEKAKKKVEDAGKELDTLAGTRTRSINLKLRGIEELSSEESEKIIYKEEE